MPSSRAAMLTPSPIRSPSLSSTTSPRWMPMRNTIRRSSGMPALRSTIAFCISIAQRTASTTLRNSTMAPSPVLLTTRPLWTAIVGSMSSLRNARRRPSVPILVHARQPAEADDVSGEDCRDLPTLRQGAGAPQSSGKDSIIYCIANGAFGRTLSFDTLARMSGLSSYRDKPGISVTHTLFSKNRGED